MNKVKKKINFKEFINTPEFLVVIFVLLLVLVVVLTVLCIIKDKETDRNAFANIVIPVYELNSDYEFSINAKTLAETDEYIFKIVNYKKNNVNEEEIPYTVEIKNETNATIKVTMNKSKKDLMKKQKLTVLKKKVLKANEKEDIYYHVKVTKSKDLTNKDLINITIKN